MARAFQPPAQLRRWLLGSGWRVGLPSTDCHHPSGPFGLRPRNARGVVVVQAIEEGEWVVVKETGRRARIVSKQSNGAYAYKGI